MKGSILDEALRALRRKVKGYTSVETKTTYTTGAGGERIVKDRSSTSKHFPPDLAAIIFVLTNRAPHLWRQKPVETTDEEAGEETADLSCLSEAALRELTGLFGKKPGGAGNAESPIAP